MNVREMVDKAGGRKLGAFVLMVFTSTILLVFRIIDASVWQNFNFMCFGAYIGGNVATKFANNKYLNDKKP